MWGEASERPWGSLCREGHVLFSEVPPEPGSANSECSQSKGYQVNVFVHFSHLLSPVLSAAAVSNSKNLTGSMRHRQPAPRKFLGLRQAEF